MAADITSLVISTRSEGIQASTKDLNALVEAADKAAQSTDKLKNSGKQQSDSQKSATSALESALLAMKKQVDLLGASVSQTNSYNAALKGADAAQLAVASSLGRQVDNYRSLSVAQTAAIHENKALDDSNTKLAAKQQAAQAAGNVLNELGQRTQAYQRLAAAQAEALLMNNALNRAQNSGSNLNASGQRAEDYKKLATAQSEAIRMNNAFNASIERQRQLLQQRDIEAHNQSVRRYTQAQAEANRMNREFDIQQRRLGDNTRRLTQDQRLNNDSLRDGQALVRGLSGGMGALWLSYGNIIGMFAGVAIAASLRQIVQLGSTIENTLEGIRVKGGESVASINLMREEIFKLGEGSFGPRKVAEAFEVLILAGLNAREAMIGVHDALNLAVVGGVSIEKAAFTLVQVSTALGLTASGFGMVGDTIAKTAAVSMSSVETLSEAFKSASVVNKMYKVSLNDIATGLAALSQLGIQGSAAGTSIRNYYKELTSQGDKVKKVFADLKMPEMSLRTANGGMKDLVTSSLELHTALSKLTPIEQERAKAILANERGMKTLVETVDLVGTKSATAGNKLQELYNKIADHAGYTALGAIQMSTTTSKQLESVWNTLQTQSIKAFTAVDGEVNLLARRMKEVLQSKEFLTAITASATALISFVLFMAENASTVVTFVAALAGFKILSGISLMISSMIPLLASLGSFFTIGGTAATGMAAAFPPLLAILAAAAAAWATYSWWKNKALNDKGAEAATGINQNIKEKLQEEIALYKKKNDIFAQTGTNRGVEAEIERETAVEKFKSNEQTRIANALANTAAARAQVNIDVLKQYDADGKVFSLGSNKALTEYVSMKTKSDALVLQSGKDVLEIESMVRKLKGEASTEEKNQLKELAAMQAAMPSGTGTLSTKPDTKGINDAYRAAQVTIDSQIKASKKSMQDFEDIQNDRFKAGEIGKLTFIRNVGEQQISEYDKIAKDLAAKRIIAEGGKNKVADVALITGLSDANTEALEQAKRKMASETNVELARLAHENTKYQIIELEAQGNFSEAASKRFSSEYSLAIQQVKKDFDKFGYAIPAVVEAMDNLREAKEAVMATADVRQANYEFERQNAIIVNLFKGVQTASEGQGMVAMYEAAANAAETYKEKLPSLIKAQQELANKASISGSPADLTKSEEALTKMKADAEHLKTMWSGVGQSISKSLESAFGNSGKAVGELLKAGTKYAELTDKSGSASVKTYGDMAGAAKGFFKENSTGYKLMEGAERTFRLIELAGLAKSLYTSLFVTTAKAAGAVVGQGVETSAVVAGETVRNAAKVPGVFMSFMSALGPWGMAAAGIAIAAVLGGAFSGSGSSLGEQQQAQKDRIATQGTGTVFGEFNVSKADDPVFGSVGAKSASISKSLDLIAKYAYEDLDYSSKMLTTMKSIAESLTGVSKSLLLTVGLTSGSAFGTTEQAMKTGIMSGLFGSSSTNITGSGINIDGSIGQLANGEGSAKGYETVHKESSGALWGLFGGGSSDSTNSFELSEDFKQAINKAYASVRAGIVEVGSQLGLGADALTTQLNSIQSKITVETRGLQGKELTDAVEAVFSAEMDRISSLTLSIVKEYNAVGEGMLETAVRVANTSRVIDMQLLSVGDTFGAVGISSLKMRMSLVDLSGGLDEFVKKSNFFKDNFLSEAERMAPITSEVNKEMDRLNISNIKTAEGFKNLVLAQDKSTPAGQAMYVALMNVQGAFYKSVEYAGKLAAETTALSNAQQAALDLVDKKRTQLQTSYDSEKTALQSVIDRVASFSEGMKKLKESLASDAPYSNAEKYSNALTKFNASSIAAKNALTVLATSGKDDTAAVKAASAAQADFEKASSNLLATSKVYNASGSQYTTDFNRVLAETNTLIVASASQESIAQTSLDALKAQVAGLIDINKNVMSVTQAITELRLAITGGYAEGLTASQMPINGSHANGLTSVPFDGYIAELHKGEQVLTAPQAINYRNMGTTDMAPLVAEIKALREEVKNLRNDNDNQTRASIQATYDSNARNADTVVNGVEGSLNKASRKTTSISLN